MQPSIELDLEKIIEPRWFELGLEVFGPKTTALTIETELDPAEFGPNYWKRTCWLDGVF